MKKTRILTLSALALAIAGCATMAMEENRAETHAKAQAMLKASFKEVGQAKLDRLNQDEVQKTCSEYHGDKVIPKEVAAKLEAAQMATIKYPAGDKYMGDWKLGERIAQTGVGMQYSDDPKNPAGGNCYACHELTKAELAYGTIGPSLYNFGKIRGYTPAMQKYTYGKIYNSEAFAACSNMPRFGHAGILTEKQLQDVVALLMDPASPVNK
ncbi:MAG: sulfur oxidation c-type cytochrome SoxX [Usitatibacter sp.]